MPVEATETSAARWKIDRMFDTHAIARALTDAGISPGHYEGEPVRVVDAEHLIALALQAGGARRRERAWLLLETGAVDRKLLREVLTTHAIAVKIPDDA